MKKRWTGLHWMGFLLLFVGCLLFLYADPRDGIYALVAGVLLWAVG